jgi:thiol:disulfide interchange protein DsbD
VISLLIYLFFLIGLSLSGYFEVGGALMNVGQSLANKEGLSGSFFTGVLATLVAAPCTAPFMASAIGFALTQPSYVALLVFASLGLGMALPYLAL